MPDNGAHVNRWNVVSGGRVLGTVTATSYTAAQALAVARYGRGVRVSAPGLITT